MAPTAPGKPSGNGVGSPAAAAATNPNSMAEDTDTETEQVPEHDELKDAGDNTADEGEMSDDGASVACEVL